jgi:acetate kinase
MKTDKQSVLAVNGGSSSIKFSLYRIAEPLKLVFFGELENIGTKNTILHYTHMDLDEKTEMPVFESDYKYAVEFLIDWLEKQDEFINVRVIGHRIVFGMSRPSPEVITTKLLRELSESTVLDPEHMSGALKLIDGFKHKYPKLSQIACFDTSFHTSMPPVAKILPIQRRFYEQGIRRYGFHGLSYHYILEEFNRLSDPDTAKEKIIIAHLGNGASMAAIKDGKSIDTSMGFTPSSGIPMSTRSGDLDPGVALYLMKTQKMNADQFGHLINFESGLLGISESSSDMRELLTLEPKDPRAAEAIDVFCYQAKKCIGSFAAALGGLNALIFSGGIGENAPAVRGRICEGLEFLGIEIDSAKNMHHGGIISKEKSKVMVRVIKTNEELMIAKLTCQVMNKLINK